MFTHVPGYTCKEFWGPKISNARHALYDLGRDGGLHYLDNPALDVTLVGCGDTHNYERVNVGPGPTSLPQVIVGGGGAPLADMTGDGVYRDAGYSDGNRQLGQRWMNYAVVTVDCSADPDPCAVRAEYYTVNEGTHVITKAGTDNFTAASR